ncbi:MAG: alpha-L-rhamnosidase N-terminal domain-containing protein, partial [Bacteroidota bacterium]
MLNFSPVNNLYRLRNKNLRLHIYALSPAQRFCFAAAYGGGEGGGRGLKSLLFSLLLLLALPSYILAQDYLHRPWPASWITHPTASATEFAVVNFRREFTLDALPDSLAVMVSADNRYQLFLNGQRVGEGPARGDLLHWRYETYDLRPHLKTGKNVIAAIVWNYGIDKPWSQQSYRLGFLLKPKQEAHYELMTDAKWQTFNNEAYSPITDSRDRLGTYIVTGPQLQIDGNKMPWGWEGLEYDATDWSPAKTIVKAAPAGVGTEFYWALVPREIPLFPRKQLDQPVPIKVFEKFPNHPIGLDTVPLGILPPNTHRTILLQFPKLVNAFHTYQFKGGEGATVRVTYAESLFDENGDKGNREEYEDKTMLGVYDEFFLDGQLRDYSTPWFRTGRYLELAIETEDDSLFITDILSEEFAYSFTPIASFKDENN